MEKKRKGQDYDIGGGGELREVNKKKRGWGMGNRE